MGRGLGEHINREGIKREQTGGVGSGERVEGSGLRE